MIRTNSDTASACKLPRVPELVLRPVPTSQYLEGGSLPPTLAQGSKTGMRVKTSPLPDTSVINATGASASGRRVPKDVHHLHPWTLPLSRGAAGDDHAQPCSRAATGLVPTCSAHQGTRSGRHAGPQTQTETQMETEMQTHPVLDRCSNYRACVDGAHDDSDGQTRFSLNNRHWHA